MTRSSGTSGWIFSAQRQSSYKERLASRANTADLPILWQLQISHYNEKVRWALDHKRIPHVRRSLLPGPHAVLAKRLTGEIETTPVLTLDGRAIGDSTRIIDSLSERPGGQWVTETYRRHRVAA